MTLLTDFHFLRPYAFLALIPLLYLVIKNYRQYIHVTAHWTKICDAELLPYLLENGGAKNSRLTLWLNSFVALIAIVALAAPTWKRLPAPAFRNNSALVIALNLSESMNAEDVKPSRLVRARYKIADLLSHRKEGQTALLVYSGAAFTVTPLTNDTETIHSQLEALTTDIMPSSGNNTVRGLEKAVELLKQAGLPQGHVLLITDSVESSEATSFAKKLGTYRLSVLGVGTTEGAPIALPEGGFAKDEMGQILVPKLQIAELSDLATAGNGRFQIMSADDNDVQNLLRSFDMPLTQSPHDKTNLFLEQWEDSGYWLILLILPWAAWQFRKGILCLALLCLLPFPKNSYAFEWQNLWRTPDQQAQRDYQKKDYSQAAKKFENSAWKAAAQYKAGDFDKASEQFQNLKDAYNQGNALAKKGQLKEALAAYEQAMKENPYDNDAKFNKELVEKELAKQQQKNSEDNSSKDSSPSAPQQNEKSAKDSEKQQAGNDKESDSKPSEEHKAGDNPPAKKEDSVQEQKAKQENNATEKQNESKQLAKSESGKSVDAEKLTTEQQQANEQWLKRIPDDPASLLKRKFKYQYSQQQ